MEIPVRIVLVEPSHPGNIGAAARAMKTMGLSDLVIVAPRRYPSPEATARAAGADDLLANARICTSLVEAVADCTLVAGTTARTRTLPCPVYNPREAADRITREIGQAKVAVLMGPEQAGLTNEHIALCRFLINVPASEDYASLNLAMATQLICYELRMALLSTEARIDYVREAPLATAEELDGLHAHLEQVLDGTGFFNPEHPTTLKLRLRRLFQRAELDRTEVNILRGAFAALDARRERKPRNG